MRGLIDCIVLSANADVWKLSVEVSLAGLLALSEPDAPKAPRGHLPLCEDTDYIVWNFWLREHATADVERN